MKTRLSIALILLLIVLISRSESHDMRGKEFWFALPRPALSISPFVCSMTIAGSDSTTIQIYSAQNKVIAKVTLNAIGWQRVEIPIQELTSEDPSGILSKGVRIVADRLISVTVAKNLRVAGKDQPGNTETVQLIPAEYCGIDYFLSTFSSGEEQFIVVAMFDSTDVEIVTHGTFTGETSKTINVRLNRGQVYHSLGTNFTSDSAGATRVQSKCKPIAVFSGNMTGSVPVAGSMEQGFFEQSYPTHSWGVSFIAVPPKFYQHCALQIVALHDSTFVFLDNLLVVLQSGEVYERLSVDKPLAISANKPIQTALYQYTGTTIKSEDTLVDPSVVLVPSLADTVRNFAFSPLQIPGSTHYLSVVVPTEFVDSVHVNSKRLGGFTLITQQPDYSLAQVLFDSYIHVTSSIGFVALVEGNAVRDSWWSSSGSGSLPLFGDTSAPRVQRHFPDSVCVGEVFVFGYSSSAHAKGIVWTIDSSYTSTSDELPHIFTSPGKHRVELQLETFNCFNRKYTYEIEVVELPFSNLKADTFFLCKGDSLHLTNVANSSTIEWLPDDRITTAQSNSPTFFPYQTTVYHCILRKGECTVKDSITIVVSNPPIVTLPPELYLDIGDTLTLPLNVDATDILWTGADWLIDSTQKQAQVFPPKTTTYHVRVRKDGCTVIDSVKIFVRSLGSISFSLPDTSLPAKGKHLLEVRAKKSSGAPLWSKAIQKPTTLSFRYQPEIVTFETVASIGSMTIRQNVDGSNENEVELLLPEIATTPDGVLTTLQFQTSIPATISSDFTALTWTNNLAPHVNGFLCVYNPGKVALDECRPLDRGVQFLASMNVRIDETDNGSVLSFRANTDGDFAVEISDVLGCTVYRRVIAGLQGNDVSLPIDHLVLSHGMFVATVRSPFEQSSIRFISTR